MIMNWIGLDIVLVNNHNLHQFHQLEIKEEKTIDICPDDYPYNCMCQLQ